ncbi:MAG TPA: ABC transporter permease [Geminicoccus sp.]|jgi:peptide/nickel transport system permease protein|uniref:ABC transporter permease n=1 Tax=Geminicoccus sp. TaxID=2024832 RepID=UPI002E3791A7|nr:ABC transporter permease [Geminicoccus sp.]HEX2527528.1 ABC transporter permease [Geminicoccus sp.]
MGRLFQRMPWITRLGLMLVVLFALAALFGPFVAPYPEAATVGDVWQPIGTEGFLFGTDTLGRDMLSRLLYGAQRSIGLALIITVISFTVGAICGFLAAIAGGWVDQLASRIVDVFMSFPALILALLVLSVMGSSLPVLVLTLAFIDGTRVFRLARAVAVDLNVLEFVEAARLRGEGQWWIARKEILPNALPMLLAEFGVRFCFSFLLISALSFLGLGIQPPAADWGGMVKDNAQALAFGLPAPLLPAGCIALLTISVNLVVDFMLDQAARRSRRG